MIQSVDSQPLSLDLLIFVQWAIVQSPHGGSDGGVMCGFDSIDIHSPRLAWIWLLFNVLFARSRYQAPIHSAIRE